MFWLIPIVAIAATKLIYDVVSEPSEDEKRSDARRAEARARDRAEEQALAADAAQKRQQAEQVLSAEVRGSLMNFVERHRDVLITPVVVPLPALAALRAFADADQPPGVIDLLARMQDLLPGVKLKPSVVTRHAELFKLKLELSGLNAVKERFQ